MMFEISDKGPVGVCGLTDIDPFNRRAEFSLYVNVDKQGSDYGYKALKTLVEYGFKDLTLGMIYGETVGANPAESIFKRVGFTQTGYRPQFYFKDGKSHDSYIYCLDDARYLSQLNPDHLAMVETEEDPVKTPTVAIFPTKSKADD
jgi:RimJ/RimL family protein N-acetyltransferase